MDLQLECTSRYRAIFEEMVNEGVLEVESPVDLWCLHFVYFPILELALEDFVKYWNTHGIRTERMQSPQKLWRLSKYSRELGAF